VRSFHHRVFHGRIATLKLGRHLAGVRLGQDRSVDGGVQRYRAYVDEPVVTSGEYFRDLGLGFERAADQLKWAGREAFIVVIA